MTKLDANDLEDIQLRITLLKQVLMTLDAQITGAGALYRQAQENEDDLAKSTHWATMYIAQVYMHGVLDEIIGLEVTLKKHRVTSRRKRGL